MRPIGNWCAVLLLSVGSANPARGQVLHLAGLNTDQIRRLDRARTVIIIPAGVLEQHGPYLPSFTDGYRNERYSQALAEAVAARPGWTAILFPTVPLGNGGANEMARDYAFPGTYTVRAATLRTVFMDLGDALGQQGFRWVFVLHSHGAPAHNRVLHQAGDYFHDSYGGRMVHLRGLVPVFNAGKNLLDDAVRAEDRLGVHAGAGETSEILFLRPDLVPPTLVNARTHAVSDWSEMEGLSRAPGWPGYVGAPRLATAAQGARIIGAAIGAIVSQALRILDGEDPSAIPRVGDAAGDPPAMIAADLDAARHEATLRQRQEEWLARKRLP